MTSVVCWLNNDVWYPGIWAVSDSRVSSEAGSMTDSLPKLFAIPVNIYDGEGAIVRQNPKRILNIGFGFAGSTLIGAVVKDILTLCLDNLSETTYYDEKGIINIPLSERVPTLEEVALLAQKVAVKYLLNVGFCHPQNARCEIVLFGYCARKESNRAFLLKNSPEAPGSMSIEEKDINEGIYIVLGDRKEEVLAMIEAKNQKCFSEPYYEGRGPIVALQQIIRNSSAPTIGGYVQICVATKFAARTMYLSDDSSRICPLLGFDLHTDLGQLGGFSFDFSPSLSINEKLMD
ncbi:hypothetical protein PSH84_08510 [Pseudomonas beijingensis]|uniref:hypothetical protein n=1 Tax=Pseudomonas beijingensis TaxID=2954101 RepID=UPI0027350B79|nr:hypothetical protein [Pseudomonas sp. FP830]WLI46899.1 hypothetical protein PSH84_08510 [Pseudomonas sp. FP830]